MSRELSEGYRPGAREPLIHVSRIDLIEPLIDAPDEPVIQTEPAPEPGVLEKELARVNEVHAMNADSLNHNPHFPRLVVASLRGRCPEADWLQTARSGIKVQVARQFNPQTVTEVALLGLYWARRPGDIFFEQVAVRQGEQVQPTQWGYQPFASSLFDMVDAMKESINKGDWRHVDPCSFRVPIRRYEIHPDEEASLLALEAASRNYLTPEALR